MDKDKSLRKLSDRRNWLRGNLGLALVGGAMLSKSLIQLSVDGWGCVPSQLFGLKPNYGRVNGGNGNLLQKDLCQTTEFSVPDSMAGHCQLTPLLEAPRHSQPSLSQSLVGTKLLSPGSWCTQGLFVPSKSLFPHSCGSSVIKSHWPPKSNSLGVLSPFAGSQIGS